MPSGPVSTTQRPRPALPEGTMRADAARVRFNPCERHSRSRSRIIVLSLGTRHSTAGSVYGDDCPPTPDTQRLEAIGCRLDALLHSTDAAELGPFSRSLSRASGHAGGRVFAALSFCSFRRTKSARRRLLRAKVFLDHYVAQLSSPEAQAIPAEVRQSLVTDAVAIAADAAALHDRLECPNDG